MMKQILFLLLLCLLTSGCISSKDKPFTVRMLEEEELEKGKDFKKTLSLFDKEQQYWIFAFVKTYPNVDISQIVNQIQDFNKTNQERTLDNFFEYVIKITKKNTTDPTARRLLAPVEANYNLIKQLE